MKNLQTHSDYIWQNNIGGQAVCKTNGKEPWKSVISSIEYDEDYQPNAKHAQTENQKPLEKARHQSQNAFSRLSQDEFAAGRWTPK